MKRWAVYILYGIIVLAACLYLLFPSEKAEEYIIQRFEEHSPETELRMEKAEPSLPPGLKLVGLSAARKGRTVFNCSELKIVPEYLTLFSDKKAFDFRLLAYGGSAEGTAELLSSSEPAGTADFDFKGIEVDRIEALSGLTPHKLSGTAGGSVKYSSEPGNFGQGSAEITVSGCRVEFSPPFFGFSSLDAGTLHAVLALEGGSVALEKAELSGGKLTGRLTGSIDLRRPFSRSGLDLEGRLRPGSSLIKKLGKALPSRLFPMGDYVEKGIPFYVSGTVEKPRLRLKQAAGGS